MKLVKLLSGLGAYLGSAVAVFAQTPGTRTQIVSSVNTDRTPFPDLGQLIGQILVIVIILASILLFIYLVIGGLQWLTSGGDKAAAQAARDRITAALTGLIIILAAFALVRILEAAFGIRVLSGISVPTQNSPFGP